jgi:hypothetical protein
MSNPPTNITAPEHWAEWFEKCALAICSDETRRAMGIFSHERYKDYLLKALGNGKSKSDLPIEARDLLHLNAPGACWYDLEDSYWGRQTPGDKSGKGSATGGAKTYKKYYREEASKRGPEGGRNWLEAKCSENLIWTRCRSIICKSSKLQRRTDESQRGLEETLPPESPGDPQSEPLLASEADEIAREIFEGLTPGERILMLAKANNITLTNQVICSRLGLGKSALYELLKATTDGIAQKFGKHHLNPEDLTVASRLLRLLTTWALSPECGIGECLTRGEAQT